MRVHYREALGLRGWTGPSRHGPMPSDAHLSRFVVSDVAQQQSICVCTLALGNASASSPDAADVLREACRKWRRDAQVESSTDRATPSTPKKEKTKNSPRRGH